MRENRCLTSSSVQRSWIVTWWAYKTNVRCNYIRGCFSVWNKNWLGELSGQRQQRPLAVLLLFWFVDCFVFFSLRLSRRIMRLNMKACGLKLTANVWLYIHIFIRNFTLTFLSYLFTVVRVPLPLRSRTPKPSKLPESTAALPASHRSGQLEKGLRNTSVWL